MAGPHWIRHAALCAAVLLALPTTASAAPDRRWHAGGLYGGAACSLATSGGALFAAAGGAGVFRSGDGGVSWQLRGTGLPPDTLALDLEAARSAPNTLYLATYEHGLWRTDDAGGHWRRVHHGATVADVGVSSSDPDTVYFGADPYTFLKSTNGGDTWTDLLAGSETLDSDVVTVAPSNSSVVYAAGLQFYRSVDAGQNWSASAGGPTHVRSLAVHPANPDVVYAGTYFDGVFRTLNGGATWSRVGAGALRDLSVESLTVDPTRPQRVYAGTAAAGDLWVSENSGDTWTRRSVPVPRWPGRNAVCGLVVRPANGAVYAATAHGGIWRSGNRGGDWIRSDRGLRGHRGTSLAVVPSRPRTAFAGTFGDGLFRTTDAGRTWQRRGLAGRVVWAVATTKSRPKLVLAGTDVGIFRSENLGRTWRKVTRGSFSVLDLSFAPSRPNVVYAADYRGVLRSNDSGRTWRDLHAQPDWGYLAVAVHPNNHRRVWVSTRSSGVARSWDGGRTWRLNGCCLSPTYAHDLAVSPVNPRVVYATSEHGGLIKSTRGGADGSWRMVTPPSIDDGYALVLDPRRPRTIYIGTIGASTHGGVYRSRDAGRTWVRMVDGMRTTWVTALAMTPGGRLYAGTAAYGMESGGGVYARQVR